MSNSTAFSIKYDNFKIHVEKMPIPYTCISSRRFPICQDLHGFETTKVNQRRVCRREQSITRLCPLIQLRHHPTQPFRSHQPAVESKWLSISGRLVNGRLNASNDPKTRYLFPSCPNLDSNNGSFHQKTASGQARTSLGEYNTIPVAATAHAGAGRLQVKSSF